MSVCLSVTQRYCVETAIHILKRFSPPDSHTILVFPYQRFWQYSDRDPVTGASNAGKVWKIAIFDQYLASRFISETIQDTSIVWSGFLSREQVGQINAFKKRIYRCSFSCELIQLETLTLAADKRLFAKMCGQFLCLHSLLSPATNNSLKHRPKGHTFELPRYSYDLSHKSFVLRWLYEFK